MGPGSRDQGKPPYPTLEPGPWNPVPVKRIYEQYTPGDQVEIIFTHLDQDTGSRRWSSGASRRAFGSAPLTAVTGS